MARPYNILYIVSELWPFAKTGGLADVAGSLSKAIRETGHDIRILIPKYGFIGERKNKIHQINRLMNMDIPIGDHFERINIKSSSVNTLRVRVQVYVLESNAFFDRRPGLYSNPATGEEHFDNDERFYLLNRAALEMCKLLVWKPDIIHCNDWQAGLAPVMLKTMYKDEKFYNGTKTVFTIHNVGYQGNFPRSTFDKLNLPGEVFTDKGFEHNGGVSYLKAGINYADAITTVSPTYADEICTKEYGVGMEEVITKKKKQLRGILNGVDYDIWNPEKDNIIPKPYFAAHPENKKKAKEALAIKFGLPYSESTPIIGVISRLVPEKGIELIVEAADDIVKAGAQLVLLGTGDKKLQSALEKVVSKNKRSIAAQFMFSDDLAHLIEAGSDMFLMPSRSEPCGLNQMYSLKYGTVPIVRATGGLIDTIKESASGNGFMFEKYSAADMMKAIKRALTAFKNQAAWLKLMKRGMTQDFSWQASAKKYVALYDKLLS